ncbi:MULTISPECIES: aminotransferase [unclassified Devosia]|uniref:aminotransferase n=1 Tax=unclassified Devosia TaxID=196773 RepID=UPI001557BA2F|nr:MULTISPECIES: aminotransferase [unclassified Devosia]
MNEVFSQLGVSIFETMSRLAAEHDAINLGQGFPEDLEPREVVEVAAQAMLAGPHQYPPMRGLPALRQAVAENAQRHFGLEVDWQAEVIVTSGATEALAAAFLALLNPGDEVILLEPAYDSYRPLVQRAGANVVPVTLEAPHWTLPREALEAAVTAKTRAIVLNTPMNPTGHLMGLDDLQFISELINRHDLVAICDEVYEHLTFDGRRHTPLMSLPEARARCVRIGSAGKSFSVTGWKVGYVTADARLLGPIANAHQYLTFTTPPALQTAVAYGLRLDADYFDGLRSKLQQRRDLMAGSLRQAGFTVLDAQGTYFLNIDISAYDPAGDDVAFAQRLVREAGVAAIPLSAFHSDGRSSGLLRLCFAKTPQTILAGVDRLRDWRANKN